MHVLQILSCTGFHGAEAMTAELSRQLSDQGVRIDIAVLDNAGKGNDDIFGAVGDKASACHRLPCDRQFDPHTLRALSALIRTRGIDVVHSHSYKTTFYAGLLKPFHRFKLVSTYHNWLTHTRALQAYAWIDKKLARFNDASVGVSTPVVTELQRHVRASEVFQVDNGIDVGRFVPAPDRRAARAQLGLMHAEGPLLGFVGRLSPEKGLHHLLEALAHADLAHVHLVIAGDGPERPALEQQIATLGLGARVHLLGYRRDTLGLYQALDAFVLPSLIEAFPMVLLEAMACGLPVIASAVGEVPRILDHGRFGWVTQPGNPHDLAQAIGQALPPTSPALPPAPRERVVGEYSSQAMAQRYLAIYQRCLNTESPA